MQSQAKKGKVVKIKRNEKCQKKAHAFVFFFWGGDVSYSKRDIFIHLPVRQDTILPCKVVRAPQMTSQQSLSFFQLSVLRWHYCPLFNSLFPPIPLSASSSFFFPVPCRFVCAKPDDLETWQNHLISFLEQDQEFIIFSTFCEPPHLLHGP